MYGTCLHQSFQDRFLVILVQKQNWRLLVDVSSSCGPIYAQPSHIRINTYIATAFKTHRPIMAMHARSTVMACTHTSAGSYVNCAHTHAVYADVGLIRAFLTISRHAISEAELAFGHCLIMQDPVNWSMEHHNEPRQWMLTPIYNQYERYVAESKI